MINRTQVVIASFVFVKMIVGLIQYGQADLSKTKPHTEAPMTRPGRAATSSAIDRADKNKNIYTNKNRRSDKQTYEIKNETNRKQTNNQAS